MIRNYEGSAVECFSPQNKAGVTQSLGLAALLGMAIEIMSILFL